VQEGACIGVPNMPQPWTLRLICEFLTKNSLRIWNPITRITSCAPKMNTPASALPRIAS